MVQLGSRGETLSPSSVEGADPVFRGPVQDGVLRVTTDSTEGGKKRIRRKDDSKNRTRRATDDTTSDAGS